jgi:hypothetical protein
VVRLLCSKCRGPEFKPQCCQKKKKKQTNTKSVNKENMVSERYNMIIILSYKGRKYCHLNMDEHGKRYVKIILIQGKYCMIPLTHGI